jgi:hypothetical protein
MQPGGSPIAIHERMDPGKTMMRSRSSYNRSGGSEFGVTTVKMVHERWHQVRRHRVMMADLDAPRPPFAWNHAQALTGVWVLDP